MSRASQSSSIYNPTAEELVYRKVLRQAVAAVCKQAGFELIEANLLELLTNMLLHYIMELGITTRQVTEVAGRTISTPSDVILAAIELGTSVMDLPPFLTKCRTHGSLIIATPKVQNPPNVPTPLRVGDARPHPSHIPDYLPTFPDPHTYIRTEISGDPDLTYEKVREQAAQIKRDTEVSLKNFMLRIHPSISLFADFESKVRREAKQYLEEQSRSKKARILARQSKITAEELKNDLKDGVDVEMPDIFEDEQSSEGQLNGYVDDVLDEEIYELEDTENSLVSRRVPEYCRIIEPILDNRPYIAALMCDEQLDEGAESPETPVTISPRPSAAPGTNSFGSEEQTVEDNPYLRAPRIPLSSSESMES
ncbi:hypothetical protein AB6A40_002682 [Gnathostoma spinigerum]|uniref:Transcription initiation factor TFIID subunit 8 n=1 Tax=Gnathostoma spinigerum TaxID=75299 RepID=A0ABD6EGB3_9BILA